MARARGKIYKSEKTGAVIYGIVAEYATPADFYHAAEAVRDAGYRRWDAYSPFPVHGMDEAMGLSTSRLPLLCGIMGLSGAGLGFIFQYWITKIAYPLVVQGKPYGAWEAFMPILFEIGVLFTAFTALLSMMGMNRLPMWYHPLLKKERFLRVSDDRFMICIETRDPKFDPDRTRALLEKAGGTNVDLVEE